MTDKLWGARFRQDISSIVLNFTETTSVDERLLRHELWATLAHTRMAATVKALNASEAHQIEKTIIRLDERVSRGQYTLDPHLEDVHLNVEAVLIAELGDVGRRIHMARSRNDLVQTDARMVARELVIDTAVSLCRLAQELVANGDEELLEIIPSYTHSQIAQPISVAFWKSSFAMSMLRDVERLSEAFDRLNRCPMGSGAIAGTSFAVDRSLTASLLAFDGPTPHAMDATSARDWTVEIAAIVASSATSLSRLCEDVVAWNSNSNGVVELSDAFTTGSSIMPQKKNAVVAELVRARSAESTAALVQLLIMAKSVGSGYSCDLQEDKRIFWSSLDTHLACVDVVRAQVGALRFNTNRGLDLCWQHFSTATELANYLVQSFSIPFRSAYAIVGGLVQQLENRDSDFRDVQYVEQYLSAAAGVAVHPQALTDVLDPSRAVQRQISEGSTGPDATRAIICDIRRQADSYLERFTAHASAIGAARARLFHAGTDFLAEGVS